MSWKGFMRRLVIGKQATADFTAEELPKNRKQVLKFVYKHRALTLFSANLIFILFAVPLIAWEIINYLTKFTLDSTVQAEYYEALQQLVVESNLLRVPFLMIASIGLAGMTYIVRKLCWNEPISLWKDFGKGIKNSWKSYLGISLILGLIIFVSDWIFTQFAVGSMSGFSGIFFLVFTLLLTLVGLIASIYAFGLASLYSMNFLTLYKASFIMGMKTFFYNILMLIVAFLPVAIFFIIPVPAVYYIGIFVVIFGGTGYTFTCATLFLMKNFDRFINKQSYPEFVDKGIYSEVLDDFEEETSIDDIENMAKKLAGVEETSEASESEEE